jgi:glycyl-tRNA synthetase beta chain
MTDKSNFLCEIGTEEIPAGYLPNAIESAAKLFREKLAENRIDCGGIEVMATPRRLAILASLAESQSENEVELKGPSAKAAYDAEGGPTKALQGFLNGNKVTEGDVYKKVTDKGEYIFAKKKMEVRGTAEIIPSIIEHAVCALPFPKRMKWSDKKVTFPRPINYFLLLLNNRVVPFSMSGIESSNKTRGHYIQNNKMLEVGDIAEYEKILADNSVILSHTKRKELIRKDLHKTAEKIGGTLVEDEELLDTVTFLVESPHVVACDFSREFLKIPAIVLITEMKEHQKYFAVKNAKGELMPNFLVVSNNPPTDFIKKGNERVIGARFTDADFFFKEDRKKKLEGFVESLKNVLFHKELGSIYDKIERVRHIAGHIIKELKIDSAGAKNINRAVTLCKADLNTALVFEFSSLQGKIGRIYAKLDGEDPEVADAIEEHYRPRSQDDEIPKNLVSAVVSISEKFDNILGSYSVGNIPKGSQDPYALRRQANAIVEILIKNGISLKVDGVLSDAAKNYKDGEKYIGMILDFVNARAKTIFTESGMKYDEIDACLSIGYYDYLELFRRAKSVSEFRKDGDFSQMLLSFKRMNNICGAFRQKNPGYTLKFSDTLLQEDAEKDLYRFFNMKKTEIRTFIETNKYTELFRLLIEGKSIIDTLFDKVMADDVKIRDNRLALLEEILSPFKQLLDFSKISD